MKKIWSDFPDAARSNTRLSTVAAITRAVMALPLLGGAPPKPGCTHPETSRSERQPDAKSAVLCDA
jgi:hypothetical protein